jgi:hypothetical protein
VVANVSWWWKIGTFRGGKLEFLGGYLFFSGAVLLFRLTWRFIVADSKKI